MKYKFLFAVLLVLFIAFAITQSRAATPLTLHPKLQGSTDSGFAGIITKITPCICNTLGFLVTISGPFGGDYIYSWRNPPKISAGQFQLAGGPVLGSAGGSAICGAKIERGCTDEKSGGIIKTIGGIMR